MEYIHTNNWVNMVKFSLYNSKFRLIKLLSIREGVFMKKIFLAIIIAIFLINFVHFLIYPLYVDWFTYFSISFTYFFAYVIIGIPITLLIDYIVKKIYLKNLFYEYLTQLLLFSIPIIFIPRLTEFVYLYFHLLFFFRRIEVESDNEIIVTIDVSSIQSNKELHSILKEKLKFPEGYDANWDAFWETITGSVELPNQIQFIGWTELEKKLPEDSKIIKDYLFEHNQEFPDWKCNLLFN